MRFEKKLMRISPKSPATYPWYLRPFFWDQRRRYGAVLDSARLWARAPKVFLGVAFLYGMIDRRNSPLPLVLRSLITVRVSQLNGCRFCVDINSATPLQRGVAVGKVEALDAWQQSDLFSESERVALEYAEAVTLRSDAIEEHVMDRLKKHLKTMQSSSSQLLSRSKICRVSSTVLLEFRRRVFAGFLRAKNNANIGDG
jgi:AhpD family alkylhydroperoxidase